MHKAVYPSQCFGSNNVLGEKHSLSNLHTIVDHMQNMDNEIQGKPITLAEDDEAHGG